MDKRILLYTSLPPELTRLIANVEAGRSYLTACIRSWNEGNFRVVSLNTGYEIDKLLKLNYDIEYQQVPGKRPKIVDFLHTIPLADQPVAGLINADVFLIGHEPLLSAITRAAQDGLVALRRMNVDPVELRVIDRSPYGFDAMIFNTAILAEMKLDAELLIGQPWWDYWFPLAYAAAGRNLMTTEPPALLHIDHPLNWQRSDFVCGGERMIRNLSAVQGRLPKDLQGKLKHLSVIEGLTYETLHSFAVFCFPRLLEMAEVIRCRSLPSDDRLLSTLISFLPECRSVR